MDANDCFLSDFTTRKSMKAFSTTVSFLQPIAAHDFTIFLFDTLFMQLVQRALVRSSAVYDTLPIGR